MGENNEGSVTSRVNTEWAMRTDVNTRLDVV